MRAARAPLEALARWWWAPHPAERLAVLRVMVGSFAWLYLVVRLPHLIHLASLPAASFAPVGVVAGLAAPPPVWAYGASLVFTLAAGAGFVAGWHFRITGPSFALGALVVLTLRNSWGMVFHTENLLVLHLMILAVSPAADVASRDARAGRRRLASREASHGYYGWPIQLCCAVTTLTYALAGWAKVESVGWAWLSGEALREQIAFDNARRVLSGIYHSPLGVAFARTGWPSAIAGPASLGIELLAPLALFRPGLGRLWCVAAFGFHLGVLATMMILFPYPLSGIAFASFFPVERLLELRPVSALRRRFG